MVVDNHNHAQPSKVKAFSESHNQWTAGVAVSKIALQIEIIKWVIRVIVQQTDFNAIVCHPGM
jgi:hypothetical protein